MKLNKLSAPSNEDLIKSHWLYKDEIHISFICIVFNQKEYIRDTIDSMLAQKTEFNFEIIIHDDASTDGTQEILLEYKKKYPSIIKLILQSENQYSQKKCVVSIASLHAQGDYLAICEGDDFWIDEYKTQKQLIALSSHMDIDICFTPAYTGSGNEWKQYCNYNEKIKIFSSSTVIRGGGGFIPTASIITKKNIINDFPNIFHGAPVGDFFIQIIGSMQGGALYLPDITSAYRKNVTGSWSNQRKKQSSKKLIDEAMAYKRIFADLTVYNSKKQEDLNYALAQEYFFLANQLFINEYFTECRQIITESWKTHSKVSKQQQRLYRKRFILPFASFYKKIMK